MRDFAFAAAAASTLLALSAPAGAVCVDEIAKLEQRLGQLDTADDRRRSVEIGDGQEQVTVETEEGGVEPQENWFGSPPSLAGAQDELESARQMADDGNEDGCIEHVEQAREIISGLESG